MILLDAVEVYVKAAEVLSSYGYLNACCSIKSESFVSLKKGRLKNRILLQTKTFPNGILLSATSHRCPARSFGVTQCFKKLVRMGQSNGDLPLHDSPLFCGQKPSRLIHIVLQSHYRILQPICSPSELPRIVCNQCCYHPGHLNRHQ